MLHVTFFEDMGIYERNNCVREKFIRGWGRTRMLQCRGIIVWFPHHNKKKYMKWTSDSVVIISLLTLYINEVEFRLNFPHLLNIQNNDDILGWSWCWYSWSQIVLNNCTQHQCRSGPASAQLCTKLNIQDSILIPHPPSPVQPSPAKGVSY